MGLDLKTMNRDPEKMSFGDLVDLYGRLAGRMSVEYFRANYTEAHQLNSDVLDLRWEILKRYSGWPTFDRTMT